MKKLLALLMALVFVFSFTACKSKDSEETTVAATTNAPAPKTPEEASKAASNFFIRLNAKSLLELMGANMSALSAEEEFSIMVLDALLSNSQYEILNTAKKDDNTFDVTVKLSAPDANKALEILEASASAFDEENPDVTPQESVKILKDLINKSFSDPSVDKTTAEQVVTVKYVDGKWNVDTSENFLADLEKIFFSAF